MGPGSASEAPKDSTLESLYKMRMRESDQLRTVLATYEQEINRGRSEPNYQKLKTMLMTHIDQPIRTRNFKVRNDRIDTGALVKTQKGEKRQR